MFDLHCHILPGIDDGAKDLATSLEMARIAAADGIRITACTPHIYPGLYINDAKGISTALTALQAEVDNAGIPLKLVPGADVHLVPGLVGALRAGRVPTLNGSRYVLLEPSHHVAPPRFAEAVFELTAAGFTPVITHPERLTWIEDHYPVFIDLIQQGAWMQVTAGALTGAFGKRAKYWGERFLGDGHTHILATDAHTTGRRRPELSGGVAIAERLLGKDEARQLVHDRPLAILENRSPATVALPPMVAKDRGLLGRFFSAFR